MFKPAACGVLTTVGALLMRSCLLGQNGIEYPCLETAGVSLGIIGTSILSATPVSLLRCLCYDLN